MAVTWAVEVLASGRENAQVVESGAVGTEREARAAATRALMFAVREWGRQEFWVTVGGLRLMVVPGLDDAGGVDALGLGDALDLLPFARTA